MSSRTTGVLSGAPSSFQSGNSSFRARGSNTAPERICAPTSEPFSTTQTLISLPASAAFCFSRQAADRPAGPAPTMTTSNSIYSRSTGYLLLRLTGFFSNGWRLGVVTVIAALTGQADDHLSLSVAPSIYTTLSVQYKRLFELLGS